MKFQITIDEFNGPLDLMLYLIKENKLDLFELNIVELTDQYIAFLNEQQEYKLEIATEYISELAGLIEYKSKKLLPRDQSELEVQDLEEEEQNLVRRLIEYQRYKEVSEELAERFDERMHQFTKPISKDLFKSLRDEVDKSTTYDQTPYDLMKAMDKVLKRYRIANPLDVSIERVELSVDDRIISLRHEFLNEKTMTLDDLLMNSKTLHHLIVTFLAVLDMLRMGDLKVNMQGETVYLKGAV
ncbi:MAG: segregation/condensation protein A [Erysipelothrix sp.]|nr:segregation/condensation protein A [Erysipelothrix sp.]